MNRYDERRPRFWRHGRDRDRDDSFRDRDYGFEARGDSGRTPGGPDQQPFSANPYGYHPGQDRSGREWGGRWSGRGSGPEPGGSERGSQRYGQRDPSRDSERWGQPYGQREPYNAQGGFERSRGGSPVRDESSRYSESQYGTRSRASFDSYGDRYEPEFGEGPFADTSEAPGYFGTGNYSDGGAGSTGGYDQRSRSRNPGSLGDDTFTTEYAAREQRRHRTGPKGYTRSDDRIREDICERLMLADSIDSSEASVSVKDGRVMLEGTVPTRSMKHAIEDVADHTAGVQDVDNRIRVERQSEGMMRAASSASSAGVQSASGIAPTSGGTNKTTKQ